MGSKSLQTRETQKSRYEKLAEIREHSLKDKGLSDSDIVKDPKIKHLKAKIRQISAAVATIAERDKLTQQLLEKKQQRKAEAEAARAANISGKAVGKGKKKAEAKEAAAGGKKREPKGKTQANGKSQTKKKGK